MTDLPKPVKEFLQRRRMKRAGYKESSINDLTIAGLIIPVSIKEVVQDLFIHPDSPVRIALETAKEIVNIKKKPDIRLGLLYRKIEYLEQAIAALEVKK